MFIDHKLKKVKKLGKVAIVRFYQACHSKKFIKTVYRIVGKFGKGIKFGEFGESSMIR